MKCPCQLLLISIVTACSATSCLTPLNTSMHIVPVSERQNLIVNGTSMPLGIMYCAWATSEIEHQIFKILMEEILGHRTVSKVFGTSMPAFYTVSGCKCAIAPGSGTGCTTDPQCSSDGEPWYWHAAVGVWSSYFHDAAKYVRANYRRQFPVSLGDIGYPARDGMFITNGPKEQAINTVMLPLEYYRVYNTTHNLSRFFAQVGGIPPARLMPCHSTNLYSEVEIKSYLELTGDAAGVHFPDISDPSDTSTIHGHCYDQFGKIDEVNGRWWLSTACRSDVTSCIPMITGGNGWGYNQWMLKATFYAMPLGIAVAKSWSEYTLLPIEFPTLMYWWFPDATFTTVRPTEIIFPVHDVLEWDAGNTRTQSKDDPIVKYTWWDFAKPQNLGASKIAKVLANMRMSQQHVDKFVLDYVRLKQAVPNKTGDEVGFEIGCKWLKDNPDIWEQWIPHETDCLYGQGLVWVDAKNKRYVRNRSFATSCEWCPPGMYSEEMEDASGKTYLCNNCQTGRFQILPGQISCEQCEAGRYAESEGTSKQCERCAVGKYSSLGLAECVTCEGDLETAYLGAQSAHECQCPEGSYRPMGDAHQRLRCKPCDPTGEVCPFGSDQSWALLQLLNGTTGPQTKPGFMTFQENTGSRDVFQCLDGEVSCPGNRDIFNEHGEIDKIGQCAHGFHKAACARCEDRMYKYGGRCVLCDSLFFGQPIANALGTLLSGTAVCLVAFHSSMRPPMALKLTQNSLLSFLQSLTVLGSFGLPLPSNIGGMLSSLNIFQMDLSLIGLPAECLTGESFKVRYAFEVVWPLFLFAGFGIIFACSLALPVLKIRVIDRFQLFEPHVHPQLKRRGTKLEMGIHAFDFVANIMRLPGEKRFTAQEIFMWYCPININDLINSMMKLQSGLFITAMCTSSNLFRFQKHPTGKLTVLAFRDVVAWSEEWWTAVPLAGLGLVFCMLFFAYYIYLAYIAPYRIASDPVFRRRYRGLWAKFDPTAWWFGIVHLLYALLLTLLPVVLTNNRAKIMATMIINIMVIVITERVRPWKYTLNQCTDIVLKFGITAFVLWNCGLNLGEELSETVIGYLLLASGIVPVSVVMLLVIIEFNYLKMHEARAFMDRLRFGQRLHDLVSLVGSKTSSELRKNAQNLSRHDLHRLSIALDILQFEMLHLQSSSVFHRRAAPVAWEIDVPGRLEGEMVALGIHKEGDERDKLRHLQVAVSSVLPSAESMKLFLTSADQNADGALDEKEFAEAFLSIVEEYENYSFTFETLVQLFKFIDVYQAGSMRLDFVYEVLHTKLASPVTPPWYQDVVSAEYVPAQTQSAGTDNGSDSDGVSNGSLHGTGTGSAQLSGILPRASGFEPRLTLPGEIREKKAPA